MNVLIKGLAVALLSGISIFGVAGPAHSDSNQSEDKKDETVVPATPTWEDPCDQNNGSWQFVDTDEYSYTVTENKDGSLTIAAIANSGYRFPRGTVSSWTETDNGEFCPLPVVTAPAVPSWKDVCGPDNGYWSYINTSEYTYTVTKTSASSQTITASPTSEYVFEDGTVSTWTAVEDSKPCSSTVPVTYVPTPPAPAPSSEMTDPPLVETDNFVPENTDELPQTGSIVVPIIWGALILIAVGVGALLLRKKLTK